MFSLIITIISIALVALLAVATVYYGGSAFTQGSSKAEAATLVSGAQQIAAAEVLYANDHGGSFTTTLSNLTSGTTPYLTSLPTLPTDTSGTWGVVDNTTSVQITATVTSQVVCNAIASQVGAASTQAGCAWNSSGTPASGQFTYND